MSNFDRVMEFILRWEGGYVNDPNDPGGETNYGISKRANPDVDIKNLTLEGAKAIYRQKYWHPIGGDQLPFPDALALMDFAVHSGVGTALNRWAQAEDAWELMTLRQDYLTNLQNFSNYAKGWMRRLNALNEELEKAVVPTDLELIQLYIGDKELELRPSKVSVGRSLTGRRKLMARL